MSKKKKIVIGFLVVVALLNTYTYYQKKAEREHKQALQNTKIQFYNSLQEQEN